MARRRLMPNDFTLGPLRAGELALDDHTDVKPTATTISSWCGADRIPSAPGFACCRTQESVRVAFVR